VADLHDKLARYFLTAGVASVVDLGLFALLTRVDVAIPVAAAASFCVAAVVNYLLSSRFAFHRAASLRGFGLFFVAALGGLAVNVGVTSLGHALLGMPPVLAKVAGIGTAFLLNFWINLRVVFRSHAVLQDK
jgi:putative flippase GtrA